MIKFIIAVLMMMLFVGCNIWDSDDNGMVATDNNNSNSPAIVAPPVKPSVTKAELVPPLPPSI